jgi:hypothetical protein
MQGGATPDSAASGLTAISPFPNHQLPAWRPDFYRNPPKSGPAAGSSRPLLIQATRSGASPFSSTASRFSKARCPMASRVSMVALTDPLLLPSAQRICSGRGGGFMQAKGDRMSVPVSDDSTGRCISCVS